MKLSTKRENAQARLVFHGCGANRFCRPKAGGAPLSGFEKEMQRRLTAKGFNTQGVDGVIGPNTIQAIRRFQASQGMVPDGYASFEVLRRLR